MDELFAQSAKNPGAQGGRTQRREQADASCNEKVSAFCRGRARAKAAEQYEQAEPGGDGILAQEFGNGLQEETLLQSRIPWHVSRPESQEFAKQTQRTRRQAERKRGADGAAPALSARQSCSRQQERERESDQ